VSAEHLDKIREAVLAEIRPLLPEEWDLKPGLASVKELSRTTVYCEYTRIEPLPEAPMGNARVGFDLTVSPLNKDVTKAEDLVDAHVVDLVLALDAHDWISWSLAEKKSIADTYLGWVVTISALASVSKTPTPEE